MIFGYENLMEDGDPVENCIDYDFQGWKICDCGSYFVGLFQIVKHDFIETTDGGDFQVNTPLKFKLIKDIKDEKYYYIINLKEFTGSIGVGRETGKVYDKSVFEHITERVLEDCRRNKCKIILNYGYEGFGKKTNGGDTILRKPLLDRLHELLDKYKIPHHNFIYLDANIYLDGVILDTEINYFSYEYTALDWERYTIMHPKMTYHGNTYSQRAMKRWKKTRNKIREKYFLSFNRLPKRHRVNLVLSLEKNNFLEKGFVSFPRYGEFWEWDKNEIQYNLPDLEDLSPYKKSLKKKLPLKIDDIQMEDKKWSYELFDNNFYLKSYFQIVTENQFTDFKDQLQFSEKVWKPITNFQPFILLGDRYQLKKMKEWGFKTFSPFIDESYDNRPATGSRFLAIEKEINKLCSKPIEEIHEWYWSIEEILRHNYYHFYGKWIQQQRNKLLDGLVQINKPKITNIILYMKQIVEDFGGQHFIYHNPEYWGGKDWESRFTKEFIPNKEFYFINDGATGDFTGEILFDIDKIYEFFEKRNIDKNRVIFLTGNHDLNHGLATLKKTVERQNVHRITDGEGFKEVVGYIKTDKIKSEIPFWSWMYNWGISLDYGLNFREMIRFSNESHNPTKLFICNMWTEKIQRTILFDKFLSTGLIKNKIDVDVEDKGWVSYITKNRIFDDDEMIPINKSFQGMGPSQAVQILKETKGDDFKESYSVKHFESSFFGFWNIKEKIKDSYIMVVVESRVDALSEDNSGELTWKQKAPEIYYPTIMTSTHFTEKTAWAILLKKPFFIYGGYGCLDALKNLGFRTFDKIFDESYQYELSLSKKVDIITNQLCELSKKDEKEVKTIIDSVESIVNHNQELLLKSINDRENLIFKYITRNIEDILKRD